MWKVVLPRPEPSERKPELGSSSAEEVDFVDLCENSVRTIEDLVQRGHLLNLRQCQDLSCKVSKTIQNIRELYSYCGAASVKLFRPALKNLYRYVVKAEGLVKSCAEKEWCAAAVFQCQNENAFREVLLDVSLCYSAIYEHAKSARDEWTDAPVDLRRSSVLEAASGSAVDGDNEDLQKRLDDHANGYSDPKGFNIISGWSGVPTRFLAKYLLTKMCHRPLEPHASTLDVYSPLLWPKGLEPGRTWGSSRFLGAGSGATGVCSTEWFGIPCAKKDFHGEPDEVFMKEAGIMAHLKHPCIVNFICCGNGSKKGDRFIAMELMEKSLSDLIEEQKGVHFAPDVAIDIIEQMARGVWYLHDQHVAHRDLKPQNVVVKMLALPHVEDHFCSVKLVDFGISKMKVEVSQLNTMTAQGIGTTRYRAPEANPGERSKVDWFKADAFSFAMTCAHLLSLETPYQEIRIPSELYLEVSKNARRPKLPELYPEALVMLLRDCWKSNPRLRPSFKDICTRVEALKYEGDASVDVEPSNLNYIKEKMEEKVSQENIFFEEVEDKDYDLPIPILPCTCGGAPKLLHESPYEFGLPYCNVCWKDCHDEVYRCGSCNFDAHPNCIEINEKVEVFFHRHPLHLLIKGYHHHSFKDTPCYVCQESLQHSDWVYRCEECHLDVHALCTKYPKELMKKYEHPHELNLIQYMSQKGLSCMCCSGEVTTSTWRYTCKSCDFDIHPYCNAMTTQNRICEFNASHQFNLVKEQRGFFCSICGSLGFSWCYHCKDCNLDVHIECLGDMKSDEDCWSRAYEEFIQEYKTKDNHNRMQMLIQLLEHIHQTCDSHGGGILSTSSTTPVAEGSTRRVHPNNRKLRKRIVAETIQRKAKQMATKAGNLESKTKHLEMLTNLERMVLDMRSFESVLQGDEVVLDAGLEKLKIRKRSVKDDIATFVQSRMRHGPRTCLFYQRDIYQKDNHENSIIVKQLLTSLRADMEDVLMGLLCEEPNHQHVLEDSWRLNYVNLGEEEVQNLQPLLGRGLKVVARVVSASAGQLSGLDRVTLPDLGSDVIWDLRALDLEKHGKPSKEAENTDVLKRAEDSAAEWILGIQFLTIFEKSGLEAGIQFLTIFEKSGLLRVRYKETEKGDYPGYTQGSVAWLCKEHVHRGLEAGILQCYPQKYYNPDLN